MRIETYVFGAMPLVAALDGFLVAIEPGGGCVAYSFVGLAFVAQSFCFLAIAVRSFYWLSACAALQMCMSVMHYCGSASKYTPGVPTGTSAVCPGGFADVQACERVRLEADFAFVAVGRGSSSCQPGGPSAIYFPLSDGQCSQCDCSVAFTSGIVLQPHLVGDDMPCVSWRRRCCRTFPTGSCPSA